MKPLILAMYLPQFHRVKENDAWWGEGFTEWTAVKNAMPLFFGHNQPEVPLNNNYYNLLEKKTMKWQADLAKKYKIDGFCIYHYWFKNGRQILEKPAENLLKWNDIDIKYAFAWPVESWARSWTGIGNSWAKKFENGNENEDYLLKQDFGNKKEWKKHFMYLLTFFKDERYIKINDKPLFYFYFNSDYEMVCYNSMILYWQNLAMKNGLKGIYAVNMNQSHLMSDAVVRNTVITGINKLNDDIYKDLNVYSYCNVWQNFLNTSPYINKPTIWQCIVNYDTTPRRSSQGLVLQGFSPEIFEDYLTKLLKKAILTNSPIVLINAWNEWGEGMHLEPDAVNGYRILESVKNAVEKSVDTISTKQEIEKLKDNIYNNYPIIEKKMQKYKTFYELFLSWHELIRNNINIGDYLYKAGYRNIAIYGFGKHGQMFYEEILNSKIHCAYIIDKNYQNIKNNKLPILSFEDKWSKVDIIIITVVDKILEIYDDISVKSNSKIISLQEIILEAVKDLKKRGDTNG